MGTVPKGHSVEGDLLNNHGLRYSFLIVSYAGAGRAEETMWFLQQTRWY